MRLEIRITDQCNYNCSYCTDMHNNLIKDSILDIENICNLIIYQKCTDIFIYGGEPTLHSQLNNLLQSINNINIVKNIIVQTNGSNIKNINNIEKLKLNISYHKESVTLTQFLLNIKGYKINEIAYMDFDDNYTSYNILKKIYNVQFCPIISEMNNPSGNKRLINLEKKDIFKEVQNDWHFIKINNMSNYDYWKTNSNHFKNKNCQIKKSTIYIYKNKIYDCFNDFSASVGTPIKEYKKLIYKEDIICQHDTCYFDMHSVKEII